MWRATKKAVLSRAQRLIDDQITKQLAPYLATGEFEGSVRSDVVVSEDGTISVVNAVARPSAVDALLAENELPFHVISATCSMAHIEIPWKHPTTGEWVLTIEGLAVVVAPKEREHWCLEDVRTFSPRAPIAQHRVASAADTRAPHILALYRCVRSRRSR